MLIDGIELPTLDRVKENLGSLLDTLEKAIVLGASSRSLLIGVMAENLLAVGTLNLLLGSLDTVFRKAKNGVVILLLRSRQHELSRIILRNIPSSLWRREITSLGPQAR